MGTVSTEVRQEGGRYRALLDFSSAIASQSNLKLLLQSLRSFLLEVVPFQTVNVLILSKDGKSVGVLERSEATIGLRVGAEAPYAGTAVERAILEQKPAFIWNLTSEFSSPPQLAELVGNSELRSGYVFPLTTPRRRLGAVVFGSAETVELPAEDLELLTSVVSHVAFAVESVIITNSNELYQRQLAEERDRLRLLLEVNNHLIQHRDLNDLFRAAAVSLRKHFGNDFAGFWILNKDRKRLECVALDSTDINDLVFDIPNSELPSDTFERMRTRRTEVHSRSDFEHLAPVVRERILAEGIQALAVAPLGTPNGPLGAISLGSHNPNFFVQEDLDLLSQIATQVSLAVDNALAYGQVNASRKRAEQERLYLESELQSEFNFGEIVGKSAALCRVLEQVSIVAPTDSSVLLHGETGTGKELIARAIHNLSVRKDRTFVRLNCAAIPSGLVESELFGHEKGAFTGALMQKQGRFEIADRGTLFLDEIGDISLDLQPKLLRALQEQEFERLGSTKTRHVDVRLICATHRDLQAMIRNSQFREDLFYRLNVFPIEIPPLRERREDIPLLVHYFVSSLSRRMQKNIQTISKDAMEALTAAPWHGNVRELENFIERAVILTQGTDLRIPLNELKHNSAKTAPSCSFHEAERQAIIDALNASGGRVSGKGGAAERLGLKRTTLQNKMRKLGIPPGAK
ncbi:MAG TPA: sigma 54-interacting transcriptional regulator [Candidatus Acidoferrales bacterium]|nr:sigma 54-interacting transcriptional regulator [Candidatus Acidoferrales bacterium]